MPDARWSIRRLSEHHMMSCDVCGGQDPTRSTYYGRGIDFAHAHTRDQKALRVKVFTTRRQCAMPVGRSDGCLSTT